MNENSKFLHTLNNSQGALVEYFTVKNFDNLQHYKDRSPPWIKLYNELLDNYEFSCLQDASKLHLVLIWLLASRHDNKLPWDAEWIAKRIGASEEVSLEVLEAAGFIEKIPVEQLAIKPLAGCKQSACLEREGETERDIRKSPLEGFESFWKTYPKKKSKGDAEKAWKKIRPDEQLQNRILNALELAKTSEDWTKDNGKWVPYPASWLNAKCWEDEHGTVSSLMDGVL